VLKRKNSALELRGDTSELVIGFDDPDYPNEVDAVLRIEDDVRSLRYYKYQSLVSIQTVDPNDKTRIATWTFIFATEASAREFHSKLSDKLKKNGASELLTKQ
jgi:hypothetical protein